MSVHKFIKTQLTDETMLFEALHGLGIPFADHRAAPQSVAMFKGVVKRAVAVFNQHDLKRMANLGAGDHGYMYAPLVITHENGAYTFALDDAHGRNAANVAMERITMAYSRSRVITLATARGYRVAEEPTANGTLVLTLIKR